MLLKSEGTDDSVEEGVVRPEEELEEGNDDKSGVWLKSAGRSVNAFGGSSTSSLSVLDSESESISASCSWFWTSGSCKARISSCCRFLTGLGARRDGSF